MPNNKGLPVHGYQPQADDRVATVNEQKVLEEQLLRRIDAMMDQSYPQDGDVRYDPRWLSVARTHFEEGFMALNRAVFQPQRFKLPNDE